MKRTLFTLMICLTGIISLTFNSCKKETPDTETQSSVDNTICESEFNSRIQLVNFLAKNTYKIKSVQTSGPTITTDTINRIITIDYGTSGIADTMDGDSRLRKGVIKATFDALWHTANSTAKVQLIGYSVSNDGGASYVTYSADSISIKHNDSISFTYSIIGGKCVATNYSLLWSASQSVTQTGGYSTLTNVNDDVYSTTGSSSGTDRNGLTYTVNIKSPLVKRTSCAWIESGSFDLTPAGLNVRTVDYGNGICDNKVSLVINGNTFTFTLN